MKSKQWQEYYTLIQQKLIHSDSLPVRHNTFSSLSLSLCHFELFGPGFAQDFRFTSSYAKHMKNFQLAILVFLYFSDKEEKKY